MVDKNKDKVLYKLQETAAMRNMAADNITVVYKSINQDSFSETIEDSEFVDTYRNVMPQFYDVLIEDSRGLMSEVGVAIELFDSSENKVKVALSRVKGLDIENLANLIVEMGEVNEIN